jgi:hypothetical protein
VRRILMSSPLACTSTPVPTRRSPPCRGNVPRSPPNWLTYRIHSPVVMAGFALLLVFLAAPALLAWLVLPGGGLRGRSPPG